MVLHLTLHCGVFVCGVPQVLADATVSSYQREALSVQLPRVPGSPAEPLPVCLGDLCGFVRQALQPPPVSVGGHRGLRGSGRGGGGVAAAVRAGSMFASVWAGVREWALVCAPAALWEAGLLCAIVSACMRMNAWSLLQVVVVVGTFGWGLRPRLQGWWAARPGAPLRGRACLYVYANSITHVRLLRGGVSPPCFPRTLGRRSAGSV